MTQAQYEGLPRGIPAASLKPDESEPQPIGQQESSAGNTRGLIEANPAAATKSLRHDVFRGEYPRPH